MQDKPSAPPTHTQSHTHLENRGLQDRSRCVTLLLVARALHSCARLVDSMCTCCGAVGAGATEGLKEVVYTQHYTAHLHCAMCPCACVSMYYVPMCL